MITPEILITAMAVITVVGIVALIIYFRTNKQIKKLEGSRFFNSNAEK